MASRKRIASQTRANKRKQPRPAPDVLTASPVPFHENGHGSSDVVLYVVGGAGFGTKRNPALRDFPLAREQGVRDGQAYLARVVHLVNEAIAAGGTHLLVPRALADWLGDHPLVADYFALHHDLAEFDADAGIVFALRSPEPVVFAIEVTGWEIEPCEGIALVARGDLVEPKVTLKPTESARGRLRGRLMLAAKGIATLRFRFDLNQSDRKRVKRREAVLSLARPGFLFHDLPYFEATFAEDGSVRLEFDLDLEAGASLERIRLDLVEEDNWRLHPDFPGGKSFALPTRAPEGARLALNELSLEPAPTVRKAPPYGIVQGVRSPAYRKPARRPRDAVIFSSWVPEGGLVLGDYFIQTLRRWHADSKIFVGINHGSSPQWAERLEASGLDVTIEPAATTLTMPSDPTGFVAALDAYRRHDEAFELVWFGHNKGGDHLDNLWYATGRWTIERTFWSRREEIEGYFEDPIIGLYSPHYLMMLPSHLRQTDALLRMYRATCAPLYAMAVSTHFVIRDESVRSFCERVDKRFFRHGPEHFGADRFFVEMAMPNVPIMQGYEPYIEPGLGGTSGQPKMDGVVSIHNDWRQNNAVVAIELEKWRRDPTRFRTNQREHSGVP